MSESDYIKRVFFIFSVCSGLEFSRISERNMISVHRTVIAQILASCLLHTVEMLRELQF